MSKRAIRLGNFLDDEDWNVWVGGVVCPACEWDSYTDINSVFCPKCGHKLHNGKSERDKETAAMLERVIQYALEENT